MGSSKKHKKESKKKKRSRSRSTDKESEKERRKHRKRHHKDRKKEKIGKKDGSSSNSDDDVIYVPPSKVAKLPSPTSTPVKAPRGVSPPHVKRGDASPRSRESSPLLTAASGNSDKSLSIDETNALRAKLGLKPLSVPTKTESTTNKDELPKISDSLGEFYHKPAESLTDKRFTEKIREKIALRKEKRNIEKLLTKVKGLGDDSDDEGTSAWVNKTKKIHDERKKAEMKAKELDEMDEVFGVGALVEEEIQKDKTGAYTASDLWGLKVEHDVEGFTEGKAIILTLKDKGVLEEDEDTLVNVNMVDDEKYKKNLLNKKIKPFGYNAVDSGEMDEDDKDGVLAKYDEEIKGIQKTSFTIGEENVALVKNKIKKTLQEKAKMRIESLVLPELKVASEYYSPEELKIKKPKKKKKIRKQILKADELMPQESTRSTSDHGSRNGVKKEDDPMDVDDPTLVPVLLDNIKIEEEADTELELALKKARRLKEMPVEKFKKLPKVEEVLAEVKEEDAEQAGGASIVLNSTAEFCRTLGDIPTYGLAGNRDEEPDLLDFERTKEKQKKKHHEEVKEDRGGWNDASAGAPKVEEVQPIEAPILDAEPDLGSGVAGALRLAMSKGYLEKESSNRPSASRFSHLAAQNYSIDDKAHAAEDEKLGRRERYMGPTSDFKEKDGYKPNIKLEYIDDDGHILSAKEAFRYLSHKFHGKGPGKNKVEKRMKKSEQEGLMKQMSSTDTPLGTLQMLQHKQKETQTPFVVLSGSKQLGMPSSISKTKMMK